MTTPRSEELQALAQRVADALPVEIAEEVVLTGSVSRGMADAVSDIEMLVVTREPLELEECFERAGAARLRLSRGRAARADLVAARVRRSAARRALRRRGVVDGRRARARRAAADERRARGVAGAAPRVPA